MSETRYSPAHILEIEVWDGSPESLAKLREFSGQSLPVNADGSVIVLMSDGRMQPVYPGYALYRTGKIRLGVKSPGALAELEDPPAA